MQTTTMTELPGCYFCEQEKREPVEPAEYDARTTLGPHAYMCQEHFEQYGTPIGTKLVKPTKQADETIDKVDSICKKCGKDCAEDSWNKTVMRFRLPGRPVVVDLMVSMGVYCEEMSDYVST